MNSDHGQKRFYMCEGRQAHPPHGDWTYTFAFNAEKAHVFTSREQVAEALHRLRMGVRVAAGTEQERVVEDFQPESVEGGHIVYSEEVLETHS